MTPWEESSTLYGVKDFEFAAECKVTGMTIDGYRTTYYPIHKWVLQTFGKDPTRWRFLGSGLYFFRDKEDAVLFTLRWS